MKKITFLMILFTASFGFSQDLLLGFEDAESGGLNGGPFGNANALQVNLVTDAGTNGTKVAEFIANSSGEIWQGINMNLTSNVDLTSTQTMTIDVKSATPITFLTKVNGGVSGAPEAAAAVTHNGDGTWQTLSFTFNTVLDGKAAMANGVYTAFVIHAYWSPGATVFGDVTADERTFYVDNIKGLLSTAETCSDGIQNQGETGVDCGGPCSACPNPPTVAPTTPPARAAADVISVYSDAYADAATDQRQPFGDAVVTDLDLSGNSVISATTPLAGAGFQYQYFNTTPQFLDLSGMTHMHIDFYFEGTPSTAGTFFTVIAQYDGGSNAVQKNFEVIGLASNTWHEMDITFDSFAATAPRDKIGQVIVQINGPDIYGPFYVDNIYFHKNTTLGTNDFSKNSFRTYPNPTQDSWTIETQDVRIASITVFDVLGKSVMAIQPNEDRAVIDGSSLKSGLYFAKVETAEGVSSVKLIKK